MTSSYEVGQVLERNVVQVLQDARYEPEETAGSNDGGIDVKVVVDGTSFVIQSKN
ncbi:18067_t:CDS:2 [Funneliformis geosporum]|nr:18067_t:CDS:2 [Funneliformis geosporum]